MLIKTTATAPLGLGGLDGSFWSDACMFTLYSVYSVVYIQFKYGNIDPCLHCFFDAIDLTDKADRTKQGYKL